jgi:hypothetical protein
MATSDACRVNYFVPTIISNDIIRSGGSKYWEQFKISSQGHFVKLDGFAFFDVGG